MTGSLRGQCAADGTCVKAESSEEFDTLLLELWLVPGADVSGGGIQSLPHAVLGEGPASAGGGCGSSGGGPRKLRRSDAKGCGVVETFSRSPPCLTILKMSSTARGITPAVLKWPSLLVLPSANSFAPSASTASHFPTCAGWVLLLEGKPSLPFELAVFSALSCGMSPIMLYVFPEPVCP